MVLFLGNGLKKSSFFSGWKEKKVKCTLCNHYCVIDEGKVGICGVRKNINGELFSLVYGKVIALHVDPIEKKPLFHFFPSTKSLSIATVGCNFKCDFCQNYEISQYPELFKKIDGEDITPEKVVELALLHGCKSISYTYTEPTIFFEFAYDIAKLAKERNIYNVFVSNGYMSEEVIENMVGVIDGINIDLKSFNDDFYRKFCKATLSPVKENIKKLFEKGIWVEVTTLIIPGLNDNRDELENVATFLSDISHDIPWHISAFHPAYKMTHVLPTSVESLDMAYEIGKDKGLNYVYCGNVLGHRESTLCPSCGKVLIERFGFNVMEINISKNRCKFCGFDIKGVFQED